MKLKLIILSVVVLVLFVLDLALGSININFWDVLSGNASEGDSLLIVNYRLPKAIVAVLVGITLSLSGVVMQTVFRNPLAGPYILGVSSGASLGVALFLIGAPVLSATFAADIGVALSAFVGAASVMFLVLAISVRLKDIMAVLILGMMLSSAAAALVDVMQYFSTESALKGFVLWAMGSLGGVSYYQIMIMGGAALLGVVIILLNIRSLDALLLGENYAQTLGVKIGRVRFELFLATSLLAGSVTAFCGPIAFVGIAVPHITRMFLRTSSHRYLVVGSLIMGAAVMLICDIISGLPTLESVLPINTVTSLFGIPVVIMVVIRSRRGAIM